MPRPRQSQGRPGTRVIPVGWEAGQRPVAEKTMTATIALRIPGGTQAWSEAEQQQVETPNGPYFTGPCRIQALNNSANQAVSAEDLITVAGYLVTVPATVAAADGHLATVADTGDATLDGRVLEVRDVVRGSLRVERDLFCTITD